MVRARCQDYLFDFVFGQNLETFAGMYCMSVLNKSRTLKPLALDEKSTFDTFPHQMQYKARLALYCITVFESRGIKSGFFIESCKFQRPRGRYFFF